MKAHYRHVEAESACAKGEARARRRRSDPVVEEERGLGRRQQPRKRAELRRAAEAAVAERHRARRLEAEGGAARVGVGLEGLELVADVGEHQCGRHTSSSLRREPCRARRRCSAVARSGSASRRAPDASAGASASSAISSKHTRSYCSHASWSAEK